MKTHSFRGKRYQVILDQTIAGFTHEPGRPANRVIYIAANLVGREALETAVHEAMHAEDPGDVEAVVDRRARAVARFLWRLGYRRKP